MYTITENLKNELKNSNELTRPLIINKIKNELLPMACELDELDGLAEELCQLLNKL